MRWEGLSQLECGGGLPGMGNALLTRLTLVDEEKIFLRWNGKLGLLLDSINKSN